MHMLDTNRAAQPHKIDLVSRVTLELVAGSRMVLPACHARGAVIQDNYGCSGVVVNHLHQTVYAGMQERGIADHPDDLLTLLLRKHAGQAGSVADAGAHADTGVHRRERRHEAKRITADIAGDIGFKAMERVKDSPVGASRAHIGGPLRKFFFVLEVVGNRLPQDSLGDTAGGQLAAYGKFVFAVDFEAHGSHLLFNEGVKLFNNVKGFKTLGELTDQILRQGMNQSKLKYRSIGQNFLGMLVGDTGGNDADFVAPLFDAVEVLLAGPLRHILQPLFHEIMTLARITRQHDKFGRIAMQIGLCRLEDVVIGMDDRLGMRDARRGAQHHRGIEALACLEGKAGKKTRFLAVRGFEHRHFSEPRVMTAVLFVLG